MRMQSPQLARRDSADRAENSIAASSAVEIQSAFPRSSSTAAAPAIRGAHAKAWLMHMINCKRGCSLGKLTRHRMKLQVPAEPEAASSSKRSRDRESGGRQPRSGGNCKGVGAAIAKDVQIAKRTSTFTSFESSKLTIYSNREARWRSRELQLEGAERSRRTRKSSLLSSALLRAHHSHFM